MPFDPAKPSLLHTLVRHYDELVDHIRHRFGDRGFAREVVHDVCVQLLEKPDKDGIRTPLALLRKISNDQALSLYRREHRRRNWVVALPDLPEVACTAPLPARQYEAGRELESLAQAIARLPERCQMVFVMHKIHELPQAEVAARMGISLKTVEKHLRLGMAACRAHLELPLEMENAR
ncbi:RNA polymerase sigma factor [compost metagenome]